MTTQRITLPIYNLGCGGGGSLSIEAGDNLLMVASKATAGGEAYISAGNTLQLLAANDSEYSLYDMNVASMEGVKSWYNQSDATGFIRLNGLRLRARHFAQGGPKL